MKYLYEILSNTPLICAIVAWMVAQILKLFTTAFVEKTFDIGRLMAPGGMPSSHSSFVTALATSIAFSSGLGSIYFAMSAAFAFIVMYDACGVRRAVGEQAKVVNNIITSLQNGTMGEQKAVRVIMGHTPFQVAMGTLLGLLIGILFNI